jgi:hypothetical protein
MSGFDVVRRRLARQLGRRSFADPTDVVRSFGAVQAQDFLGALWAIGLRLQKATERSVEDAIAEKTIVRTWPMRGTLHFVAAADVRWMLELMTPYVVARGARRLADLGLDDDQIARSRRVVARVLEGGGRKTRKALYRALEAAKISTAGQRGIHILWCLAQEGFICFGARAGKEQTFVLLDEWLPAAKRLPKDEALAEVSRRYFTGHGPATVGDFVWWSGLPVAKARSGIEMAKSFLEREVVGEETYYFAQASPRPERGAMAHLLPAFDEYVVGYKDRTALVAHPRAINAGGGMLAPAILLRGRVAGTWSRTLRKDAVVVTPRPFAPFDTPEAQSIARVVRRYGEFLGRAGSMLT